MPGSGDSDNERRGELFREAQIIEEERKEQKREEQAANEAKAAQSQMAENMNAMHLRGEKLESLANKTAGLESEAANFADLAKQLKDKTKKQSKWGF